jgi:competence protein ComFB
MEDIVLEKVNEIFDEEIRTKTYGYCTCNQCRMDVACYVLNRVQPQYMLSSRGLAHLRTDYQDDLQKAADLMSVINDGIKIVSSTQRPHTGELITHEQPTPAGPFFNFPTIMGRLFNGKNFEPIRDISVSLLSQGEIVQMVNHNWQNPYPIVGKTAGNYSFWPYPASASSAGEKTIFEFELFIEESPYEELHHFFEFELTAEEGFNDQFHLQRTFSVEDLYLFPL